MRPPEPHADERNQHRHHAVEDWDGDAIQSNIEARFWAKVDKQGPRSRRVPGRCWLWTGASTAQGYGQFRAGQTVYAHAWPWVQEHGPVPDGLELDHLCRVRACVRSGHLEAVTHTENVRRGQGHGSKTHCPSGHLYSGANLYVTPSGWRRCRTCNRERHRRRAA